MSTVAERPASAANARPRPLEQIFPLRGDANRGREMQATWRSFCRDRSAAVKAALSAGRSPPEIAYQLGELLHNHFRTRGVTLTSYELRRLVAELLVLHGPAPDSKDKPAGKSAFDGEPHDDPWADDGAPRPAPSTPAPSAPARAVQAPPVVRAPPIPAAVVVPAPPVAAPPPVVVTPPPVVAAAPSPMVAPPPASPPPAAAPVEQPQHIAVAVREPVPFAQLLTRTLELVASRLVSRDRQAVRAAVDEAVNMVAAQQGGGLSADIHSRLVTAALSELIGLGLIDRLWADRSVRAIFVNGPQSIFVDRDGALQPIHEAFRDEAHLLELVTRLVGRPASGVADFQLRDGSSGFVIFPPVAPNGPVLTLRRAAPSQATLVRLIASGLLDRTVADLLRLGARSRLNMLVTGPQGAGKTALLAAVAHDLDGAMRVVTVARHREFRWPVASKVELVTTGGVSFSALIEAGPRLEAAMLVLDAVQLEDVAALTERLLRGEPGTLASLRPDVMSAALARSADLVVRIDRGPDGLFRVMAVEDSAGSAVFRHDGSKLVRGAGVPVFAAAIQARGHGEALAELLR
jgi:Flp pilus assembly CpaF family ATPase